VLVRALRKKQKERRKEEQQWNKENRMEQEE
jgi:hypothetical protein